MSSTNEPNLPITDETSPVLVFVLTIITCGLYLVYWYYVTYRNIERLTGSTPTGNVFVFDLVIAVVTVLIWGIYVDYKISQRINELNRRYGLDEDDTTVLVVVLDLAVYVTGYLTGIISSAIHQHQLNRINQRAAQSAQIGDGGQAPPPAVGETPYN